MKSLGLLAMRLTVGGLLMGHGAQKLWGSFDGPGPERTADAFEGMGMKPGHTWAHIVGWSEFGGGLLTALGFMHPLGPIVAMAPMIGAAGTAHKGKPIWATAGGAELPLVNTAALTALTLTGPGAFSFDAVLRTSLGWKPTVLLLAGMASGLIQAMGKEPQEIVEEARSTAEHVVSTVREQIAA